MPGPSASRAISTPRSWRVLVGTGVLLAAVSACGQTDSTPAADTANDHAVDVAAAQQDPSANDLGPLQAAIAPLRATITASGMASALSDDTLQALGNGVCRQLAVGTDRAAIVSNLRSVALGGASDLMGTPGSTSAAPSTADQWATAFVDAAEADYC